MKKNALHSPISMFMAGQSVPALSRGFALALLLLSILSCDSCKKDDTTTPACSLRAKFSLSANNCPAPCTVSFTNLSTGTYTNAEWIFGGNGGSSVKNPAPVTFTAPGSYTIRLKISDGACSHDTTILLTVTAQTFQKKFGTVSNDYGVGVLPRKDGQYWVYGTQVGSPANDVFLHLSESGEVLSETTSSGQFQTGLYARDLSPFGADGYLKAADNTKNDHYKNSILLQGYKQDPTGTSSFLKQIFSPVPNTALFLTSASRANNDDGFILTGYVITNEPKIKPCAIKIVTPKRKPPFTHPQPIFT